MKIQFLLPVFLFSIYIHAQNITTVSGTSTQVTTVPTTNNFSFQVNGNSLINGKTIFNDHVKIVDGKKLLWQPNYAEIPSNGFNPGVEVSYYDNMPVLKFSNYNTWVSGKPTGFDFVTDQNSSVFRITPGRVGINTNLWGIKSYTPKSLLHISNGKDNFDGGILLDNNTNWGRKFSITSTSFNNVPFFSINDVTDMAQNSYDLVHENSLMNDADQFTGNNFKNYSRFVINSIGNVGIGTTMPDKKLTVKGEIHAEGITIDLLVPADYVFEKYYRGKSDLKPDYKMLSLKDVEEFVKTNNHLPGIPSAKEIQEEGLNLGNMTNLLLQKIEELTLYNIEMQKQIIAQQAEINSLKNKSK